MDVYKQLFEVMKSRRGSYTGIEIPEFYTLVQELFTPEEAEVNNVLSRRPATAANVAEALGKPEEQFVAILETMADKGLCKTFVEGNVRYYQGELFMPGIFEYQFISGKTTERAKKIAVLIHSYKKAFQAARGEMKMTFPTARVIPVDRTIGAGNTVHTYDQVATYIDKYDIIGVGTCFCRHEARLLDKDTHGMPMEMCMWFGNMAAYAIERLGARRMTKQEARQVLDQAEEAGLIHMSRNTTKDIEFICNCDRWHCGVVSTVLKQSRPALFFNSGFQPRFDTELCTACGTCIERCPSAALSLDDVDGPRVDLDRCFGCAVCAGGCPAEAITMEAKAGFPVPPKDMDALKESLKSSLQK